MVEAFWYLSTSRVNTGTIPLTEIEAYCRIFPVFDIPRFASIIRRMDRAYIAARLNSQPSSSSKGH